ncbi:MAG: hypothetical protein C0415_05910 [Thermodesulfovibrio sp.]|nr:hypothetical protein [Thermodesulfovibrio sp.]
MMNYKRLKMLYQDALAYIEKNKRDELDWARSVNVDTFNDLKAKQFLTEYCWVVYVSGFRVAVVEKKFPALKTAFKNFDIEELSKLKSVSPVLQVINHKGKANGFLNGAKMIYREGFSDFKKRLEKEGINVLCELPYIGNITKKHLAKNIGFADVAKNDIWLERVRDFVSAKNVDELTEYLSTEFNESKHVVDVVLWRFCADNGLPKA